MSDAEKIFLFSRGLPCLGHDHPYSPEFLLWLANHNEQMLRQGSPTPNAVARALSQQGDSK